MTATTHTFSCNLCEALCGLRVTVEDGAVRDIRGNPSDVLSRGHICPKGPALAELLADPDRLRQPLVRTADGFAPIGWDDALDLAARRLNEIRARYGRDAVAYYVGNPTVHSHRAALGAQLLQAALGTHNRFDPNSQDSNPRLFACMQMYGDGLSIPVPDVDRTDLLILLGANPAASNGSQMGLGDVRTRLRAIKARGRVAVIDPRRTETVALYATEHHAIRPGGDAALLFAMLHVLFSEGRVARNAIAAETRGLGELAELARRFPPERVAPAIDVAAASIRELAKALAETPRAVVYGRLGTCQNAFGPVACWLIEALNIVTGHLDREGGAMFPQPAADVGPLARLLVGNRYNRWRSRVRGLPELFGSLPSAVMAEEMETPGPGQIRALVCMAGNPVLSTPNGPRLERAIAALDFVVAVDLYLNETARHAHLVLPPAHIFETGNYDLVLLGLTVRNVAKYSPPILPKAPAARDDWEILSELALRLTLPHLGARLGGPWRRATSRLPERIVDLLLRAGRHHLRLRDLAALPDGLDLGPLTPCLHEKVKSRGGLVELAPPALTADVPRLERWLDAPRAPLVMVGRRHLRSNNSWMHNLPSLVRGKDRATLLMHPEDAAARRLANRAHVRISSRVGAVEAILETSDEVPVGVVSFPHGFGHWSARAHLRVAGALPAESANDLTDELLVEPVLGTSIFAGVPVEVSAQTSLPGEEAEP